MALPVHRSPRAPREEIVDARQDVPRGPPAAVAAARGAPTGPSIQRKRAVPANSERGRPSRASATEIGRGGTRGLRRDRSRRSRFQGRHQGRISGNFAPLVTGRIVKAEGLSAIHRKKAAGGLGMRFGARQQLTGGSSFNKAPGRFDRRRGRVARHPAVRQLRPRSKENRRAGSAGQKGRGTLEQCLN